MNWSSSDDATTYARQVLRGDLVYLRATLEEDYDQLIQWWMDPATLVFMSNAIRPRPDEPLRNQLRQWSSNDDPTSAAFSVVRQNDDALVGRVALWGAQPPVPSAVLGVFVDPDVHGQGLGTDAVRVMVRYGFEEMGVHRVQLDVYTFNTRGISAYKKLGFVEEGRRREVVLHGGEYHDELIMAILASEYAARQG